MYNWTLKEINDWLSTGAKDAEITKSITYRQIKTAAHVNLIKDYVPEDTLEKIFQFCYAHPDFIIHLEDNWLGVWSAADSPESPPFFSIECAARGTTQIMLDSMTYTPPVQANGGYDSGSSGNNNNNNNNNNG